VIHVRSEVDLTPRSTSKLTWIKGMLDLVWPPGWTD